MNHAAEIARIELAQALLTEERLRDRMEAMEEPEASVAPEQVKQAVYEWSLQSLEVDRRKAILAALTSLSGEASFGISR